MYPGHFRSIGCSHTVETVPSQRRGACRDQRSLVPQALFTKGVSSTPRQDTYRIKEHKSNINIAWLLRAGTYFLSANLLTILFRLLQEGSICFREYFIIVGLMSSQRTLAEVHLSGATLSEGSTYRETKPAFSHRAHLLIREPCLFFWNEGLLVPAALLGGVDEKLCVTVRTTVSAEQGKIAIVWMLTKSCPET